MYFENREQAGKLLANILIKEYIGIDCVVLALGNRAYLVAEQIAISLKCPIGILTIKGIDVPGEGLDIGGISNDGDFSYNKELSQGEIDDYSNEYHSYFDNKKLQVFEELNRSSNDGGVIDKIKLKNKVVIVVSDGFKSGSSIDVVYDYLKPVKTKKFVVVAPISTVQAIDKIHLLSDEVHILDVKTNYMGRDHYYSQNVIPTHEEVIARIKKIMLN